MSEPLSGACEERYAIPFQHYLIDCIALCPDEDEPFIAYVLVSGERYMSCFSSDKDCDAAWAIVGELKNRGFVDYENMFFRIAGLEEIKKEYSPENGHILNFVFREGYESRWRYPDAQSLEGGLAYFTENLSRAQAKLTTGCAPKAKQ